MKEMINNIDPSKEFPVESIKDYIDALGNKNGLIRKQARIALVNMGEPVIDVLAELTIHPQVIVRWEAVKALSQINSPLTAPILINSLEDDYEGVRWLAADGLITLGKNGLIAILEALSSYRISVLLREGAHHVLNELSKSFPMTGIRELVEYLEHNTEYLRIPIHSRSLLKKLIHTMDDPRKKSLH